MQIRKYLSLSLLPTAILAQEFRPSEKWLVPRQNAPFAVDKDPESNNVLTRLEFTELMADVDAWNIYMLALTRFKDADPSDPLSYAAIMGIHGQPFKTWNQVDKCPKCDGNNGYCHHLCVTFGFWHRPYIALFDRQLRKHAMDAASEFSGNDKNKYTAAAQRLLCPYWDWALPMGPGEPPLPDCLSRQSVNVITPEGPLTIENPLWRFNFSKVPDHSWIRNSSAGTTIRDTSQITADWRRNIRANIWAVLSSPQQFNSFGTESETSGGLNPRSLEACHDDPHGAMGGDMAVIQNSGFDPAFIPHHCAVDRFLAIWQAVHPNEWMQPQAATMDTRTHPAGTVLGPDSPLMPFRSDTKGGFWTSNFARSTLTFGYTYKGIGSQSDAAATMNKYYRDGKGSSSQKQARALSFGDIIGGKVPNGDLTDFLRSLLQNYTAVDSGSTVNEYTASIKADSSAMPNSFTIYLFDDDSSLPSSPATWPTQPNILGTHNFLARRQAESNTRVNGAVSLTDALLDRVADKRLSDMNEDTVQDYLHQNMKVRCVDVNSQQEVPLDRVPGFNVTVQRDKVNLPTSRDGLPQWVDAALLKPPPLPGLPPGSSPAWPEVGGIGGLKGALSGGASGVLGSSGDVGKAIMSGLPPLPQGLPSGLPLGLAKASPGDRVAPKPLESCTTSV